mgnify:CR=1 FL=1
MGGGRKIESGLRSGLPGGPLPNGNVPGRGVPGRVARPGPRYLLSRLRAGGWGKPINVIVSGRRPTAGIEV